MNFQTNRELYMCSICSDKKHYRTHVYTAQNILYRLSCMTKDIEYKEFSQKEIVFLNQLQSYGKHPHFMCGMCTSVNTEELINLEKKIDMQLVRIARNITTQDRIYHDALRLLQGEYSEKYNLFKRYVAINKKT